MSDNQQKCRPEPETLTWKDNKINLKENKGKNFISGGLLLSSGDLLNPKKTKEK